MKLSMKLRELLCSLLSAHAATSLIYFSYMYGEITNQIILQVFFLGSVCIALFLFIRNSLSHVVLISSLIKLVIILSHNELYLTRYVDIFLSGLIASTSIIFAIGEVSKSESKPKASSRLLIYINIITLTLVSVLSYLSTPSFITTVYLASLLLIIFYMYIGGHGSLERPNYTRIYAVFKKIPTIAILVYMCAVFTINTFYLIVGELDLNSGYFKEFTVFYIQLAFIIGVFISFITIKKKNINFNKYSFLGLTLISVTFFVFKDSFERVSVPTFLGSLVIGFLTSFVISNTISEFSTLSKNYEKITLVTCLTAGQFFLSIIVQGGSKLVGVAVTDWDTVIYITLLPIAAKVLIPKYLTHEKGREKNVI
ncbi:hypothetical protein JZM27_20710 [Providencia huaxiensis]|uniref:hypothetical protein n=1 Tax=Providencia huaxiensis TaxID=2027290 RepID=UPI0019CF883D|nr:hypothetical protein [Providencia huaxiensis]MBN6363616.1 hypothetical protein [Providencia huaxiensis]